MSRHAIYTAEPIAHPGRKLPPHVTVIRRTYVSDHNAFMSQNCLRKYVYRNNLLIFTGKLHAVTSSDMPPVHS